MVRKYVMEGASACYQYIDAASAVLSTIISNALAAGVFFILTVQFCRRWRPIFCGNTI